jgi:hypothetical protein
MPMRWHEQPATPVAARPRSLMILTSRRRELAEEKGGGDQQDPSSIGLEGTVNTDSRNTLTRPS